MEIREARLMEAGDVFVFEGDLENLQVVIEVTEEYLRAVDKRESQARNQPVIGRFYFEPTSGRDDTEAFAAMRPFALTARSSLRIERMQDLCGPFGPGIQAR